MILNCNNSIIIYFYEYSRDLALTYATLHADMASHNRKGCNPPDDKLYEKSEPYNFGLQNGITNGAQWYSVKGGDDFIYFIYNLLS